MKKLFYLVFAILFLACSESELEDVNDIPDVVNPGGGDLTNDVVFISDVLEGNEIIIVMGDKPVATLSPFITKKHARKLGTAKGQITVKNDFKEIPEEFKDYIPLRYCWIPAHSCGWLQKIKND